MLPVDRRLRRPAEFAATIRGGARAGRNALVVHLGHVSPEQPAQPAIGGFVVSKAVGNSVVRHRVVRRLRHLTLPVLDELPPGTRLVVRALPPAASASSEQLQTELRSATASAVKKLANRTVGATGVGDR